MSITEDCGSCGKNDYYWKMAKITSGETLCPKCHIELMEEVGVFATLLDYKKWLNSQKEHRDLVNNYVNTLKKYGTFLKDRDFIRRIILIEEEMCEKLFKKDRKVLKGTSEELLLIATIQYQLIKDFPDIKEEDLEGMSVELFHTEHRRYYSI